MYLSFLPIVLRDLAVRQQINARKDFGRIKFSNERKALYWVKCQVVESLGTQESRQHFFFRLSGPKEFQSLLNLPEEILR
jgi:hypothetical protein